MLPITRHILKKSRQLRTYATKHGANPLPEMFDQRIVLSNGATYVIRSTSPRQQVVLSKDTRNHPLWNPDTSSESLQDESGQLARFAKRFGDMEGFHEIDVMDSGEAVSSISKKAIASAQAPKKKPEKGKK
ncbi:mitochondrial 54S ribosomal protein bL31m [Calcarisporiella thermophila]|uniref:mitochondrial 54S ribosomal protein bL31m n=1 Tax=Calcarisporiella thermophila TaxID=911321 RepID=UPI0037443E30